MSIAAVFIWVYGWLIKLYPQSFRINFADEMLDVFEHAVEDAARQGVWVALTVCLREFADLPVNLIFEHARHKGNPMKQTPEHNTREIETTRWIARISSLLLTAFFGFVILRTEQSALFIATILFMTATLLIAWRWEKTGALLTLAAPIVCAVLVGLNATVSVWYLGVLKAILWGMGCTLVVLLVWFLPYQLIAWLFLSVGRRTERTPHQPVQSSPA